MESSQQIAQQEEHKRTEGKRLKEGTGHSVQVDENQKIGHPDLKMQKNPAFLAERKKIFDELIEVQNKRYQGKHSISSC